MRSYARPGESGRAHGRLDSLPAAHAVEGLEAIDAARWDQLVPPGGGGLRHGFLRAWEQCELPALRSRPLVIPAPSGSGLVAGAAAYSYELDLLAVDQVTPARLVSLLRRAWPRLLVTHVLELGAPVAATHPLLLQPEVDQRQAADALIGAALAEAGAANAPLVIVQDLVEPAEPLAEALRAHGFARLQTLPSSVFENRYGSFEEYLQALRTKYRSRTRQILEQSGHLQVERVADFTPLAGEFSALWRLVYDRATETRREILAEPFFSRAAALEETSAIVLRRPQGSIAAFGLLLEDAPWLHFLQTGFSAEAGRDEAAYFRLLLEVLRAGIEGGFRFIHLGCTALGPKLRVGAAPLPLHAWVRHRNRLINAGFHLLARRSGRQPSPEAHKIFAQRH